MKACQRGKELLVSLKRSEFLPPYDEEGVRSVLQVRWRQWKCDGNAMDCNGCNSCMVDVCLWCYDTCALQEMNSLWQELYATLEGGNREDIPDSIKVALVFHHHCLLRDKQYAIAYHQVARCKHGVAWVLVM